jgi:hypothetical protein
VIMIKTLSLSTLFCLAIALLSFAYSAVPPG